MSHPDETTLDRYRTGELGVDDLARVEAHLEGCKACRERLGELEAFADRVGEGYAAAEGNTPEPDWDAQRASILDRIGDRAAPVDGSPEHSAEEAGSDHVVPGPWARLRRWAPQAAAAAIAILVVGVLWNQGIREPEDVTRTLRSPEAERVERATGQDRAAKPAPTRPGADRPAEAEPTTVEPPAAPQPEAAPAPAEEDAVARPDGEAVEEAEAAGRERAAPTEMRARDEPDPDERFEKEARRALARDDSEAARDALALYRDSVDVANLSPARADTLDSLADSLATILQALSW